MVGWLVKRGGGFQGRDFDTHGSDPPNLFFLLSPSFSLHTENISGEPIYIFSLRKSFYLLTS